MGRVFVTSELLRRNTKTGDVENKFNLKPALKFGRIIYLMRWTELRNFSEADVLLKMEKEMSDFGDDDYILMAGNPAIMSAMAVRAALSNRGSVNMLLWENHSNSYRVLQFNFEDGDPYR